MANPLRAVAARIGRWPAWLKVVSSAVVVVLVVAAVAIPVTLRLRAQPTAAAPRTTSSPSPTAPGVILSPGADSLVADLTCRVPISSDQPGSGGFVGFPAATFASDPGSNISPGRYYSGSLTYDRAVGKWLPAARSAVTPDGSRFVYWSGTDADFHVVNASTNAETAIGPRLTGPAWLAASAARRNWASGGPPWGLVEAAADGVYAVPPYGATIAGLWFFPFSTGTAERQIAGFGYWQSVSGSAAWGTRAPTVPQGATVTILRLDVGSGVATDWFSQDGEDAVVAGFDAAGRPVVVTSTESDFQVWLVDGQKHGTELLNLPREEPKPGYGNNRPVQSVIGDATGVWMAVSDGLYLYRNGRTQKVSTVTGQLGGGCGT